MANYRHGDRIYVFGFSRGAYTALALAGMLRTVGLLSPGAENLVPYAIKLYARNTSRERQRGRGQEVLGHARRVRSQVRQPGVRAVRPEHHLPRSVGHGEVRGLAQRPCEVRAGPLAVHPQRQERRGRATRHRDRREPAPVPVVPVRPAAGRRASRRPEGGLVRGRAQRRRWPVRRPPALRHRARLDGRRGGRRGTQDRREAGTSTWSAYRPERRCRPRTRWRARSIATGGTGRWPGWAGRRAR